MLQKLHENEFKVLPPLTYLNSLTISEHSCDSTGEDNVLPENGQSCAREKAGKESKDFDFYVLRAG